MGKVIWNNRRTFILLLNITAVTSNFGPMVGYWPISFFCVYGPRWSGVKRTLFSCWTKLVIPSQSQCRGQFILPIHRPSHMLNGNMNNNVSPFYLWQGDKLKYLKFLKLTYRLTLLYLEIDRCLRRFGDLDLLLLRSNNQQKQKIIMVQAYVNHQTKPRWNDFVTTGKLII